MNKNNKLLLQDFLRDSTDLRLSLFATMVNGNFKLDKKNKEQLMSLINDYKLDESKRRLDIIETFVAGSSIDKGLFKPSMAKKKMTVEQTTKMKELSDDEKEIKNLRMQLSSMLRIQNRENNPEFVELKRKITILEDKTGYNDPCPPEKSKLDVVFGVFGHWDDPESVAYELIHGHKGRIEIRTNQDLKQAFSDLCLLSGRQTRKFFLTSNELGGGVKGSGHKPTWTFVDANSGNGPADSNMIEMVDGQIKNAGVLKYVGQPNLNPLGNPYGK